jgi:hypothetical protein
MAKEAFEIDTKRGRIGDRLQQVWREKRGTEPDLDRISEVLDETGSPAAIESEWLGKARDALGL